MNMILGNGEWNVGNCVTWSDVAFLEGKEGRGGEKWCMYGIFMNEREGERGNKVFSIMERNRA